MMSRKPFTTNIPQFAVGDYVFVKLKGFQHWPAQVKNIMSKNVYGAVFFGSENTANVGWKCIQHYDDKNRAKYNSEKQMKKKAYREALEAVEYQKRYNELFDQQASVENVEQDEVLANVVSLEDLEKKESCDKTNIKIKTEIRDLESPRLGYKKNLISKVQPVERVNKNGEDNKSKQLKIQLYLLEITCSIQTSVSLEKSRLNLDQALSSLQDLQTILDEASGFILLKYPQIVETQMSLCDYIGKTVGHDCWDMKKNEIKQFACKAQLIREIAMVNFQTVEKKFDISPESSFKEIFTKMSAEIQQLRVEKNLDFNAFFEVLSMEDFDNIDS